MKQYKKTSAIISTITSISALLLCCFQYIAPQTAQITSESTQTTSTVKDLAGNKTPSDAAVMASFERIKVTYQLGQFKNIIDSGSIVLNNHQNNLDARVSSKPYIDLKTMTVDGIEKPSVANAWLSKATRQYESRNKTGNTGGNYNPPGWHQVSDLNGKWNHAVDRGHLIAYAIAGKLKGFDASTDNPKNIITQTAWSNEAKSEDSKGQNYYEGLVRKALDQNKKVRLRVTPLYERDTDLVPIAVHYEAKSSDDTLTINVVIPNIQPNITIDYTTGVVSLIY